MIKLHREAKSRLSVDVVTQDDSTSASVSFAFAPRGERPDTFTAGNWADAALLLSDGSWTREAVTPRIGEGALDLEPGHYRFFAKLVNGPDEDIWEPDEQGLEVQ